MRSIWNANGRRTISAALVFVGLALTFTILLRGAGAQANPDQLKPGETRPGMPPPPAPETVQTIFLTNASQQNDLNDIQTDLRNVLPRARIYGVASQNAITLRATAEDLETAQKLIADLDRPKKVYRLTFTITDFDGGRKAGSQHFAILAVSGQRSTFKQGSRVPIVTGTSEGQAQSSQVQYEDVGLSIEATVSGSPDALNLRTKVEQSSLADEKPGAGAQDPVIRQTVLDVTSEAAQGKPLVLGSLDIPGTTRSQEVEVVAEPVH